MWQAEKDKEKANKVAQQVRRAAALTAELAAQSEKKTAAVCDQPPGLDELAGHIEAPNMGAGGSHPQATMMPDPWATFKCPSASQAVVTSPLPASQGFSNFSGKSRKGQPRSDTRAGDNTAVLEETLRLFVEATDKDEASMRQQLVNKSPAELLRRSRILENTRGGEATLPSQEEGSVGVLQKDAELQTQEPRGIRGRIQAKGDDWILQREH